MKTVGSTPGLPPHPKTSARSVEVVTMRWEGMDALPEPIFEFVIVERQPNIKIFNTRESFPWCTRYKYESKQELAAKGSAV